MKAFDAVVVQVPCFAVSFMHLLLLTFLLQETLMNISVDLHCTLCIVRPV